jgi:hypothetical protein
MRWFALIVIAAALVAQGEMPATLPATTRPAAEFNADAPPRKWFVQLASPDQQIRDEARIQLMGLSRDGLPALRKLVEKSRPLAAEQAAALHEIVVHLYLSGEPYSSDNSKGFLGLQNLYEGPPRMGVPVQKRIPGFPSFQMLRPGDLILAVVLHPDSPTQEMDLPTPNGLVLHDVIMHAGSDQTVVLQVLRQGQTLQVPLRLRPAPVLPELAPVEVEAFFANRVQKGEDYWQREFMPLLRPRIS